jgi:hypothetical protein
MWQTLLNLLTFHRDFASEAARAACARARAERGAFWTDAVVTVLAAIPTAFIAVLLEPARWWPPRRRDRDPGRAASLYRLSSSDSAATSHRRAEVRRASTGVDLLGVGAAEPVRKGGRRLANEGRRRGAGDDRGGDARRRPARQRGRHPVAMPISAIDARRSLPRRGGELGREAADLRLPRAATRPRGRDSITSSPAASGTRAGDGPRRGLGGNREQLQDAGLDQQRPGTRSGRRRRRSRRPPPRDRPREHAGAAPATRAGCGVLALLLHRRPSVAVGALEAPQPRRS